MWAQETWLRALAALTVGVWAAASAHPARANGAFPDSQGILTPADRPHEIILATNFGFITTQNDGQDWTWACEHGDNTMGVLFQLGPAPRRRLFAVANSKLIFSDDIGCTWTSAGGLPEAASIVDAFPDPSNASRVMAVTVSPGATAAAGSYQVFESSDGGVTLPTLRYTGPAGQIISGVEIARSDPQVVYLTLVTGMMPQLARSVDGGAHWETHDLGATLGTGTVRLISIDPNDPRRVFLRFVATNAQKLAVTSDAGATVAVPLSLPGGLLQGFARTASGTLVAAGVLDTTPALYRSTDNGASFMPVTAAMLPSLRGLSARGEVLFGAADNFNDGFAVGTSSDGGATWQPLMDYTQVRAIDACVKAACQDLCTTQVDLGLWSDDVCTATAPTVPIVDVNDGGASGGTAGAPGGTAGTSGGGGNGDGAAGAGGSGGVTPPPPPAPASGCHCELGGRGSSNGGGAPAREAALVTLALSLSVCRARARRRRRRPSPRR